MTITEAVPAPQHLADVPQAVVEVFACFEAERARLAVLISEAQDRLDTANAAAGGLVRLDDLLTGAHDQLAEMRRTYRQAIDAVLAEGGSAR